MKHLLSAIILGLAIIVAAKVVSQPVQPAMITVTGQAEVDTLPQIAYFSATVSELNADKDTAVNQVNSAMDTLITAVKTFGIDDSDIKTQQASVYEVDEGGPEIMIFPPQPRQQGWQASNSIEITLRDIEKASALTDLLNGSGATSVSGPSFTMDDTADLEIQLLTEAIADAKEKAQTTAQAAGRRLGKVITVSESGNVMPLYYRGMEAAVGSVDVAVPAPIEPGTQTSSKTVTVVFELR